MTTTINAVTGTGLTQTSDGSGIVKLQSNGVATNALAWVNFAGATGTIRTSYNISSVTRNGTGDYTVNFTNTLTDANYAMVGSVADGAVSGSAVVLNSLYVATTSSVRYGTGYISGTGGQATAYDYTYNRVAIFGN